jgi:hypothetical protein
MDKSTNPITSNPEEVAGTYRLVVHYASGGTIAGDWFVVEPTRIAEIKIRRLAGQVQDLSLLEQFSIKQDGNVVGVNLPYVTHIVLEKK